MQLTLNEHRSPKLCTECKTAKTKLIFPFTNETMCHKCRLTKIISKSAALKIDKHVMLDDLDYINTRNGYGEGQFFLKDSVMVRMSDDSHEQYLANLIG